MPGHASCCATLYWPEGRLPADLAGEIRQWRDLGASRYFMTVGFDDDMPEAVARIAAAKREALG